MLSPIPSRYCPEPLACDPTLELFWAAYEGNLELVVRSLRAGADVNEQLVPHTFPSEGEAYELHSGWPYSSLGEHAFGDTPLHIAARTGALAVVEELVRWRASELITNDSGETAIDIAGTQAVRNAINATRVLDEQSTARSMAWIDAARDTMVAFEQRAQERAHGLLNLQDNPFACLGKSQDNEKEIQQELPTSVAVATPEMQLCWAVYEGSLELAESAILEGGANVNEGLLPYLFPSAGMLHDLHQGWPYSTLGACEYGDTPLHVAARRGDEEMIQLLLRLNADVTAPNDSGCIPAHVGSTQGAKALLGPVLEEL